MPRYWWVSQNQTYKQEVGGGYMWSPKTNKNGGFSQYYKNMTEVSPGDLVFSFADKKIKTVGVVSAPARSEDKPNEFGKAGKAWGAEGWLVSVDYEELENPIKPKEHIAELAPLLPEKYSPIRADGDGNQIYLAEISEAMADKILFLIGTQTNVAINNSQVREIQNRTDISSTEKYQLVRSRLGQGQFRKNLEQIETGCRITGVTDRRFLTASHIKPWAKSNDFEKLDGNNGLLLAPHIDRLFDRGFISFEDSGDLIVSSVMPDEVLDAWAIKKKSATKPLKAEQSAYMSFHRIEVFRMS